LTVASLATTTIRDGDSPDAGDDPGLAPRRHPSDKPEGGEFEKRRARSSSRRIRLERQDFAAPLIRCREASSPPSAIAADFS